jgi:hypothetical protein
VSLYWKDSPLPATMIVVAIKNMLSMSLFVQIYTSLTMWRKTNDNFNLNWLWPLSIIWNQHINFKFWYLFCVKKCLLWLVLLPNFETEGDTIQLNTKKWLLSTCREFNFFIPIMDLTYQLCFFSVTRCTPFLASGYHFPIRRTDHIMPMFFGHSKLCLV